MSHEIDFGDGGFVRIRLHGVVDLEYIEGVMGEVLDRGEFRPGIGTLWDLCDADVRGIGDDDLRRMKRSREDAVARRGSSRVALPAEDDLTFGVSRMSEVTAEVPELPIRVFRDEASALEWLREAPGPHGGAQA